MKKTLLIMLLILVHAILWAETLRVGLYEKEPLMYVGSDDKPAGFFVDILNSISGSGGYDFDFIISNYDYLREELLKGNIDMVAAMPMTGENIRIFSFNKERVFTDWGQFYSMRDDTISTYLDLNGKTISFLKGDAFFQSFFEIAEKMEILITYKPEESYEKVFESISTGKSDAGIVSWLFGLIHSEEWGLKEINVIEGVADLRFGFSRRYTGGFADYLDSQILIMKKNPDSVFSNYFGKILIRNDFSQLSSNYDYTLPLFIVILFLALSLIYTVYKYIRKNGPYNVDRVKESTTPFDDGNPAKKSGIFFDNVNIATMVFSAVNGYKPVFVSENIDEFLGCSEKELTEGHVELWNLIDEESRKKVLNLLRAARKVSGDFTVEISLEGAGERRTYLRVHSKFRRNGEDLFLYCTFENIDEIVELRDMLKKMDLAKVTPEETKTVEIESGGIVEKEIIKKIINSIHEPILIKNGEGETVVCNESYKNLMKELKKEFGSEKEFGSFCSDEEKKEYISDNHVITTGKEINYERTYSFRKGKKKVLKFSKSPYMDEHGDIAGVVILQKDITEKKDSEEKLLYNEKRLRETQKIAKLGTWEYSFIDNSFFASEETFAIFGIDEKSNIDFDSFLSLFKAVDRKKVLNYIKRLEMSPISESFELSTENVAGSSGTVVMKSEPVLENGVLKKVLGTIMDVTEVKEIEMNLKKAKAEAESANRIKGEFLANMSHEIRTPMNAIVGMGHLLLKTEMTEKQKDYVNKIKIAANNLLGIINDILDFSKIEAGKLDFEYIDFSLNDVLENLINVTSYKASQKGLEMIMRKSNNVPENLVGDPLRLGQVLLNLVNNAIKFTEKGEILISISAISESEGEVMLRFDVKDTGIGLNEAQISRLFKPFAQADASDTRKYGGTGLGLVISKKLVNMMEGDITVSSEVNNGSTFSFTSKFALQREKAEHFKYDFTDLKEIGILVVDDNEDSRMTLREYISGTGIRCECVTNGYDAIEILRNPKNGSGFDLVIMDYKMPVMDGVETTLRIKGDPNIRHLPLIIMITAYANDLDRDRVAQCGFDAILNKPFSPSTLMDRIMEVFGKKVKMENLNKIEKEIIKSNLEDLRNYVVMLVEDNDINRQITEEILNTEGLKVFSFEDGKKAVEEYVKNRNYDLILMDLQMPVMDGYQATVRIRETDKDIPIIAMTADAIKGVSDRCMEVGMNDYISKPIDPVKMVEVLSKWLKNYRKNNIAKVRSDNRKELTLPESVHLDFKKGLEVVLNDYKVYKNILRSFKEEFGNGISGMVKKNDSEEKNKRLLHTLKGVSGSIGAYGLYVKLKKAEEIYNSTGELDPTDIDDEIAAVTGELELFLKMQTRNENTAAKPHLSESELRFKLKRLRECLNDSDMEAKEIAESMEGNFRHSEYYKELMKNINSFKFKDALVILDKLPENTDPKESDSPGK